MLLPTLVSSAAVGAASCYQVSCPCFLLRGARAAGTSLGELRSYSQLSSVHPGTITFVCRAGTRQERVALCPSAGTQES